ncbi:MAG TPA: hypothetical protein VN654_05240 [Vicinamibacterales bacterium]|nr:hypothetical protein [Vicinamibacterales bacterium]
MTDAALAAATLAVTRIEVDARAYAETRAADDRQHDLAVVTMRQAGALRRALENWIVTRALQAQQAGG